VLGHVGLGQPNLAALGVGLAIPALNIDVGLLANAQTFYPSVVALEAPQDIAPGHFADPDVFYQGIFDVEALPNQILPFLFEDPDTFYVPVFALEAAQNIAVGHFADPDVFYTPMVVGEATDLQIAAQHHTNANLFYEPQFVVSDKEPTYDYPIGRGLYSDYGIRASMTFYKRRMIIGRR